MTARRASSLLLLVALAACNKEVAQEAPPADVVLAAFVTDSADPAYLDGTPGPKIPLPSDLALQAAAALPAGAQKELLGIFIAGGGFPSDQEVPITIPVRALHFANGAYARAPAPAIDLATVVAAVKVLKVDGGVSEVAVDSPSYTVSADTYVGTLTLHKAAVNGSRRWAPGRYVVAVRGGPSGVRTTGGLPLSPERAIALVAQNRDLSNPENQPPGGLTAGQVLQLEQLRGLLANPLPWCNVVAPAALGWLPVVPPLTAGACAATPVPPSRSALAAAAAQFSLGELASIQTFEVAPVTGAVALVDAGSGSVPLPFDLLRTGPGGTIASNPAFGVAAPALATLDGFSTTAMLLAPTSAPIDAGTVSYASVFLYELDALNPPARLPELAEAGQATLLGVPTTARFLAEPPPITQACAAASGRCSTVIGLQPAVGVPLTGTPLAGLGICARLAPNGCAMYIPPLEPKKSYAVVITNRVLDATGHPLARSTVSRILLETTGDLYDATAQRSLLAGVDDATAKAMQTMRLQLGPVMAALPNGTTAADVVAAYTFKTQTVVDGAAFILQNFGADAGAEPAPAPTAVAYPTKAEVAADYGVPEAALTIPGVPAGAQPIAELAEVTFTTKNLLLSGFSEGGLDPAHPTDESITALVALPNPALVTTPCPQGSTFPVAHCAPLVVFRHGFPRAKGDMLPLAASLAAKGFVVAAIDADKHGDRTYCTADNQCLPPATCVADPNLRTSVDATAVGRCAGGNLLRVRVDADDKDPTYPAAFLAAKGVPLASGNLYVSANLIRTRDSVRQDVVDQARLIHTLAPAQPRTTDAFAARMASLGYAIHPSEVYFASLSLGSMNSVLSVALNPRIKKAAFNAGGATLVDIFANPNASDHPTLVALLGSFDPPILEGTPQYLQFLQVAKWILDPGDPANYGGLPSLRAKPILSQIAFCDSRVPNDQNRLFTALLGLSVPDPTAGGTGTTQWFINAEAADGTPYCPTGPTDPTPALGRTTHSFLLTPTPVSPAAPTLTLQAQKSFGEWLATGAAQPGTVRPSTYTP